MNSCTFFLSQMTFALKQVIFSRKKGHLWAISISHLSIFFAWQSVPHPPQCWTEKKLSQRKKKNKESDDWAKERRKIENNIAQIWWHSTWRGSEVPQHDRLQGPVAHEQLFQSCWKGKVFWVLNGIAGLKLVVDWSTSHCPIMFCASIPVHNKFDSKLARGHGQQICKLPLPVVGKPVRGKYLSFAKYWHARLWIVDSRSPVLKSWYSMGWY